MRILEKYKKYKARENSIIIEEADMVNQEGDVVAKVVNMVIMTTIKG